MKKIQQPAILDKNKMQTAGQGFCPKCLRAYSGIHRHKKSWIGEFAPNLGHDPHNPFPLKRGVYPSDKLADL